MSAPTGPRRVVGVGNPFRRDDGAGVAVVRRLAEELPPGAEAAELTGEATELVRFWEGSELAVVVDAVASGAPAGTLHHVDATTAPLPAELCARSTHGFGVAQAVELGRSLGRLPRRLIVVGVEGRDFGFGEGLSAEVEEAVDAAVELVLSELKA